MRVKRTEESGRYSGCSFSSDYSAPVHPAIRYSRMTVSPAFLAAAVAVLAVITVAAIAHKVFQPSAK